MKLNNKGFAITIVLYGIFVLFLLLLVSMLGIISTYKLRLEKLNDEGNGAREIIGIETTPEVPLSCTITATKATGAETLDNTYFTELLLTVTATKGNTTYSFDGSSFGTTKTKTIASAGTITAYVKTETEQANCQITITSRTEYRKNECISKTVKFRQSYSCQGGSPVSNNFDTKNLCENSCTTLQSTCGSTNFSCSCNESYTGECDTWGGYGAYGTTVYTADEYRKVQTRTTYKAS